MNSGFYDTRKEQIERDFLPAIIKGLKAEGFTVSRKTRRLILEELSSAAMVGACAERDRILAMVRTGTVTESRIVEVGVMTVLGYAPGNPPSASNAQSHAADCICARCEGERGCD